MMSFQTAPSYHKFSASALNRVTKSSPQKTADRSYASVSTLTSNSTPHAPRLKKHLIGPAPTKNHVHTGVSPAPRQAWQSTEVILVKPFRRSKFKQAPTGVPSLDLSKFNEPDSQMEPIKVRVTTATDRSNLSWGTRPTDDHKTNEPVTSDLEVEDVNVTSNETTPTSANHHGNSSLLEPSQAKFVESKLLSNERGKPQPNPVDGVFPRHPEHKPTPAVVRGPVMVPEASLNKKLRFEARVLTQNGRDVHRELCGFFFLADGSMTIYEFRQFGKKSSALPIIQRGVYHHLFGPKRGDPYEINLIKRGKTLHFKCTDHPGLPDTMSTKPILGLKVTYVDEAHKKLLLTQGRTPIECRAVEVYLNEIPDEIKDKHIYKTLQGLVCSRLRGRASKTLVGLGRALFSLGDRVTKQQLQQSLRTYHISLTVEDMSQLWSYVTSEQNELKTSANSTSHSSIHSNGSLHCSNSVSVDGCISRLVGPLNEDRMALIRKVFRKLDVMKTGTIELNQIQKFFNVSQHPSVLSGQRSSEEVWFSLFNGLQAKDEPVTYSEFEHFYHGVSIETPKDCDFISILTNCWSV